MDVTGKTKIWRNEKDGRVWYTRTIASKKYLNGKYAGDWIRAYETVQMPKGTDLANGTLINVTKAFEAVSEYKGKTYRKLVVMEYEVLEEGERETEQVSDSFEAIDEDVPF